MDVNLFCENSVRLPSSVGPDGEQTEASGSGKLSMKLKAVENVIIHLKVRTCKHIMAKMRCDELMI